MMNSRAVFLKPHMLRSQLRIQRCFTSTSGTAGKKRRKIDETTLAGAQHKASLSGPSLGYLIAELSATRPGMKRKEGETMLEEHRTLARQITQWVIGLPAAIGTILVGINWMRKRDKD